MDRFKELRVSDPDRVLFGWCWVVIIGSDHVIDGFWRFGSCLCKV